jgi:hypothetical protein
VSHPAVLLGKIVDKLGAEYVQANLSKFSNAAITTFCYSGPVIGAPMKSPEMRAVLVSVWKDNAGSNDFATANTFADTAPQIDSLFKLLEPAEAFAIVLKVCKAADWNAFSAINLRNPKFSSTPVLVDLARKHVNDNRATANEKSEEMFLMSAGMFAEKYLVSSALPQSAGSSQSRQLTTVSPLKFHDKLKVGTKLGTMEKGPMSHQP